MSREPKLRVVDPASGGAIPTEDEARVRGPAASVVQASERMVRAMVAPAELARLDHELLLALTVGEECSTLAEADRRRAAELAAMLAERLGSGAGAGSGATQPVEPRDPELRALTELASSLRAACGRGALDELGNERLIRQAMRVAGQARPAGSRRWALVGSVAALAAGVALFFASFGWRDGQHGPAASHVPPPSGAAAAILQLVPARSTETLFDPAEKFPVRGGESARVDKIASARAADLRANRFAAWGVP
jgi:hypothetical protein